MTFRKQCPTAWIYHQNTLRWPFNTLEPEEEPWPGPPFKEYPNARLISLPPKLLPETTFREAVDARLSCRNFLSAPISMGELANLLWLGNGVAGKVQLGAKEHLERPLPSGGGLYPLELYVIGREVADIDHGVFHYSPLVHGLEQLSAIELTSAVVSQLFMNQPYLGNAAALVIISAMIERTMHKYADRGYRYMLLEAGHSAQNICLGAAALGLGALPLGGFFDGYLANLLEIDLEQEIILYGIAIGRPATRDRVLARNISALLMD